MSQSIKLNTSDDTIGASPKMRNPRTGMDIKKYDHIISRRLKPVIFCALIILIPPVLGRRAKPEAFGLYFRPSISLFIISCFLYRRALEA
jgi:hypothetical protein